MKIELLKDIINLFDDKKNTILYFIDDSSKLNDFHLEDINFYLNDKIYIIKKNNLELSKLGKIIHIDDKIGIKYPSNKIIYINPEDYYIFIKKKKYKNKEKYFIELLNIIIY